MAIYATKKDGKVGIVKSTVPLVHTAMREIDLIGVCRFKYDYPLAIQLIASGKVNLKPLVTHKFDITQAIDAFMRIHEQQCRRISQSDGSILTRYSNFL